VSVFFSVGVRSSFAASKPPREDCITHHTAIVFSTGASGSSIETTLVEMNRAGKAFCPRRPFVMTDELSRSSKVSRAEQFSVTTVTCGWEAPPRWSDVQLRIPWQRPPQRHPPPTPPPLPALALRGLLLSSAPLRSLGPSSTNLLCSVIFDSSLQPLCSGPSTIAPARTTHPRPVSGVLDKLTQRPAHHRIDRDKTRCALPRFGAIDTLSRRQSLGSCASGDII
jgi:hypothetical protein